MRIPFGRRDVEESDYRHRRLLGARRQRPSDYRSTEERNELAALHRCWPLRACPLETES
jgi:hypothetical protein